MTEPNADPPPIHPDDNERGWYYLRSNQTFGPVPERAIRAWLDSGFLSPGSLVWRDGLGAWTPIGETGVFEQGSGAPAPSVPARSESISDSTGPDGGTDVSRERAVANFAGFGSRLAAYIIDNLILTFVLLLALFPRMLREIESPDLLWRDPILLLSSLALSFGYYVLWESSAWQATPGKKVMRLRVTDLRGRRLNFLQAALRHLSKILSSPFYIGYFVAAFTPKRQALHDLIASTLVLRDE